MPPPMASRPEGRLVFLAASTLPSSTCLIVTMYNNQKVVVVMPAYNAAKTLRQTYDEVRAQGVADLIILVDDRSRDDTVAIAQTLAGMQVHVHEKNLGYGGNQKTCYRLALEAGADIVVMIHPDYQYTPKLLTAMVSMIAHGLHPCVLGSRILGGYALRGGMPAWKYVANRFLTFAENVLLSAKLSEYHTGYRAFRRGARSNRKRPATGRAAPSRLYAVRRISTSP